MPLGYTSRLLWILTDSSYSRTLVDSEDFDLKYRSVSPQFVVSIQQGIVLGRYQKILLESFLDPSVKQKLSSSGTPLGCDNKSIDISATSKVRVYHFYEVFETFFLGIVIGGERKRDFPLPSYYQEIRMKKPICRPAPLRMCVTWSERFRSSASK